MPWHGCYAGVGHGPHGEPLYVPPGYSALIIMSEDYLGMLTPEQLWDLDRRERDGELVLVESGGFLRRFCEVSWRTLH